MHLPSLARDPATPPFAGSRRPFGPYPESRERRRRGAEACDYTQNWAHTTQSASSSVSGLSGREPARYTEGSESREVTIVEAPVKTGFTGSSDPLPRAQVATLRVVMQGVRELHHGDCVNGDALAHSIARDVGARVVLHPPLDPSKRAFCEADEVRDPLPYLDRDLHIVLETDELIACPRSRTEELRSGTWATVRYARYHRRPIVFVWPDGSTSVERPGPRALVGDLGDLLRRGETP